MPVGCATRVRQRSHDRYPDAVIDPKLLREDPDRIRAAQVKRGLSAGVVDEAMAADERRRSTIVEFERLRGEQKTLGKQIPKATGEERQELLARTKILSSQVKAAESAQAAADAAFQDIVRDIP